MQYAVSMIILLPSIMNGMHGSLALSKHTKFSTKSLVQKRFVMSHLRNVIATPEFSLAATNRIIKQSVAEIAKDDIKYDKCTPNILIEQIVFQATEYKSDEKKYAEVLKQLREHGWSKDSCCIDSMLHSAVISDLPEVTQELLCHDKALVHATDMDGCIPLHYAQSHRIAKMLLDNGSKVDARDKDGNTPLHFVPDSVVFVLLQAGAKVDAESNKYLRIPGSYCGGWHKITPLRKAVDEGYRDKVGTLLSALGWRYSEEIDQDEKKLLLSLANLRFWRTKDQVFMSIKALFEKAPSKK